MVLKGEGMGVGMINSKIPIPRESGVTNSQLYCLTSWDIFAKSVNRSYFIQSRFKRKIRTQVMQTWTEIHLFSMKNYSRSHLTSAIVTLLQLNYSVLSLWEWWCDEFTESVVVLGRACRHDSQTTPSPQWHSLHEISSLSLIIQSLQFGNFNPITKYFHPSLVFSF